MGLSVKMNKIGKNVAGRSELQGCRKPRVLTCNGCQRADDGTEGRGGVRFETPWHEGGGQGFRILVFLNRKVLDVLLLQTQ